MDIFKPFRTRDKEKRDIEVEATTANFRTIGNRAVYDIHFPDGHVESRAIPTRPLNVRFTSAGGEYTDE